MDMDAIIERAQKFVTDANTRAKVGGSGRKRLGLKGDFKARTKAATVDLSAANEMLLLLRKVPPMSLLPELPLLPPTLREGPTPRAERIYYLAFFQSSLTNFLEAGGLLPNHGGGIWFD
ncbi:hypothetical protein GOBAR_AA13473 [Gossypium barbadense]|uniref:Uncharacterized protein n=1 Tax=Gossypium barbadense TaxID=3634 RepID=A0A2P5XUZ8_GOSBA|nr:hypothetical protein GOBAR_AA13473 [Gossypium barbadense]